MKKVIILVILLSFILGLKLDVYAQNYTDKFIIAEEIEGIYFGKNNGSVTQYRKAKFKRRVSDNQIVYCIEPFVDMIENSNYNGYDYNYEKLLNMATEKWEKVMLISYYGYGYKNHTDSKWYAITQLLIWQTIEEESDFFYTETFKGKRVTRFVKETNEIKELVNNHFKKVSFDNEIIDVSINSEIILEDKNQVLENYELVNNKDIAKIDGNRLIINTNNKQQELEIRLEKKDKIYKAIPIIYVSNTYQNVLSVGSYNPIISSFKLKIDSGKITIYKKDKDTEDFNPQGEALLQGTTYELYDEENKFVDKIIVNEEGIATLSNIKYGNYMLKESVAGKGYLLDKNVYFFNINNENKNISLELYNQVIKSKVKIVKFLSDNTGNRYESNITFQIINNKGEVVQELITDEFGTAIIELPYGTYKVKQINTSNGYNKVDDFEIIIDENTEKELEYFLYDLKVPNTYQKSYFNMFSVILISLLLSSSILVYKNAKSN